MFSGLRHHGGWWKCWRLLIDALYRTPPIHLPLPHRANRFVLLMTPSGYDLIQFALGNWWHTDTLWCRRRGSHAGGGGPSLCKHSSLTNKVLLLIINGSEGGSERSGVVVGCVAGVGVGVSSSDQVCVCSCLCSSRRRRAFWRWLLV